VLFNECGREARLENAFIEKEHFSEERDGFVAYAALLVTHEVRFKLQSWNPHLLQWDESTHD